MFMDVSSVNVSCGAICLLDSGAAMIAVSFGGFWMRGFLFGALAVVCCGVALAQPAGWPVGPGHTVLTLWPKGAPGPNRTTGPEGDTSTATSNKIAARSLVRLGNVSVPTLTLFAPKGKNTGAAGGVFRGGGDKNCGGGPGRAGGWE